MALALGSPPLTDVNTVHLFPLFVNLETVELLNDFQRLVTDDGESVIKPRVKPP